MNRYIFGCLLVAAISANFILLAFIQINDCAELPSPSPLVRLDEAKSFLGHKNLEHTSGIRPKLHHDTTNEIDELKQEVARLQARLHPDILDSRESGQIQTREPVTEPPKFAVTEPPKFAIGQHDFLWKQEDMMVSFARMSLPNEMGNHQWLEIVSDTGKHEVFVNNVFQEVSVNNIFKEVQIFDPNRQMLIRIDENQGDWCSTATSQNLIAKTSKKGKGLLKCGAGGWSNFLVGHWQAFEGRKVEKKRGTGGRRRGTSGFDAQSIAGLEEEEQEEKGGHPAYKSGHPPPPQHSLDRDSQVQILVLMAAYRDPFCGQTLFEAFQHAQYPNRIKVGVVEQRNHKDVACLDMYCEYDPQCRKDQVKIIRMELDHVRGVMPARYKTHTLIHDEEFCLQIDAHSVFEDNWDMLALHDWWLTENEMAVMTTYPNRATMRHQQAMSPARCSTQWDTSAGIVADGVSASNVPNPTKKPFLVPFFGAGVAFSKCHALLNVPYDPYMPFLFKGEEFNRAARLFTYGYDNYAPLKNYVYHWYDDDAKPDLPPPGATGGTPLKRLVRHRDFLTISSDFSSFLHDQTILRWKAILGMPDKPELQEQAGLRHENFVMNDDMDYFGLGTRRSLKSFEEFSKTFLDTQDTYDQCHLLGKFQWVPYEYEHTAKEPFRPSGQSCSSGKGHSCCTNFAKSLEKAEPMLELTTEQLYVAMAERLTKAGKHNEPGPHYVPVNLNC